MLLFLAATEPNHARSDVVLGTPFWPRTFVWLDHHHETPTGFDWSNSMTTYVSTRLLIRATAPDESGKDGE